MIEGATPMRASVSAKVLFGPATTMSQAPTSPMPPARTCPSITPDHRQRALHQARSSAVISRPRSAASISGSAELPEAWLRSAPAQNVPPVCPSSTIRTSGSATAARSPSCRPLTSSVDRALRLCGEFSVSRAARPSTR